MPGVSDVMNFVRIQVECYSGYRANERPVAFVHEGRRREVAEVLDRWCEGNLTPDRPAVDYFKVRTTEGEVFLLRYLSLFDSWSLRLPKGSAG